MADTVDKGNITTPDAANLNTAARKYCASQGWALSDGSYPIRPANMNGKRDLAKATQSVGRGGASTATIRAHIKKRAQAIGAQNLLPDSYQTTPSSST
jgi:hypothetical protein